MSAVRFRTRLRSGSAPVPQTCVSGREWKGMEGNGRDNYIIIVTYVSRGGRR